MNIRNRTLKKEALTGGARVQVQVQIMIEEDLQDRMIEEDLQDQYQTEEDLRDLVWTEEVLPQNLI